jgi:hypothetical protein
MLALLLLMSVTTPLDDEPAFKDGRRLYDELEFEQAIFRFEQAAQVRDRTPSELATLKMWVGLSHGQLGDFTRAGEAFRAAVDLDPDVQLPVAVSPKLDSLLKNARSEREARLREDAPDGALSPSTQKPGVDPLGVALWGGAISLGIAGGLFFIATGGLGAFALMTFAAASDPTVTQVDAQRLVDQANLAAGGATVTGAVGLAFLVGGTVMISLAVAE